MFDDQKTVSWAVKVDQTGFLSDAPKYGYVGTWMGPGGAMDVSGWVGAAFTIRDHASNAVAFTGTVAHRADDGKLSDGTPLTGETVLEMDFTALTTQGLYHIQVDGLGCSWSFRVGQVRDLRVHRACLYAVCAVWV